MNGVGGCHIGKYQKKSVVGLSLQANSFSIKWLPVEYPPVNILKPICPSIFDIATFFLYIFTYTKTFLSFFPYSTLYYILPHYHENNNQPTNNSLFPFPLTFSLNKFILLTGFSHAPFPHFPPINSTIICSSSPFLCGWTLWREWKGRLVLSSRPADCWNTDEGQSKMCAAAIQHSWQ